MKEGGWEKAVDRPGYFTLLMVLATCIAGTALRAGDYSPRYWVEGAADRGRNADDGNVAGLDKLVGDIARQGWRGIVYWGADRRGAGKGDPGWNRLFNSGDAITSGAFNAGYNVIVSDKVVPADAYWIYASGGAGDLLPPEVVELFSSGQPVFIQCGGAIPSGPGIHSSWKTVLAKCGVDATAAFKFGSGSGTATGASLPSNQAEDLPYTGYYKEVYLRFTGSDAQRGTDLRAGTVIPAAAFNGTVHCTPNRTYGKGPYIVGQANKYVVTATCLNWEVAYPISHLLSGGGILPSSNVWGIVGKNVTALLAIETTELEVTIPGLADGSPVHVVVWDRKNQKKSEESVVYRAPYQHRLAEYDLILINSRG